MSTPDPAEVHRAVLILDGHADTPQRFLDEAWNFSDPLGEGMLSLETARAGNLSGGFFAAWADPSQWQGRFAERTRALIESVRDQVHRHPDTMALCATASQILAARASGRYAALISIEGGHSIENDLGTLQEFHRLGASSMTLTWANSNEWAASSGDHNADNQGLAPFGRVVVREMNRLGMIVDISHVADRTFADVLATTRAPVIASHSSARALTHSPRNLTDPMLRALARNGGVVMANFFPAFLDESWRQAWIAQRPGREAAHQALAADFAGEPVPFHASNRIDRHFSARLGRVPLSALIDHLDHMIQVAGIDHVGLGSDFDGIPHAPADIDSAADLPRITEALLAQAHAPEDLHKLLGGNLLRVFREVEAAAESGTP